MALNQNSTVQQPIAGDDVHVRALLNEGWRWSAPGNANVVHWAVDATWTPLQVRALAAMFAAWGNVANITFVQVTNLNDAEIVLHQTIGADIGNFGGYSGTPGEAVPPPATPVTFDAVTIAEHGQVHTYLATDGFLITGQPTFIPNPDTTNRQLISNAGFELISTRSAMRWA